MFNNFKVVAFYRVIKYLVLILLMFGLIGDLFFSPTLDIKIQLGNFIIGLLSWELEVEFRKDRYASNQRLQNESESHYLIIGDRLKQFNDLKNEYYDECLHELLFLKVLGPGKNFKKKDKPLVDSLYNEMKNKVKELFNDTYYNGSLPL